MSKFITCVSVDVAGLKASLPKNSYVHGCTFNPDANRVELLWEHDNYRTKYLFPVEFPPEALKGEVQVPEGIIEVVPTVAPQIVDRKPVRRVKGK